MIDEGMVCRTIARMAIWHYATGCFANGPLEWHNGLDYFQVLCVVIFDL